MPQRINGHWNMTEDEIVGELERSKIYGETEAMNWVIQQHPPSNP